MVADDQTAAPVPGLFLDRDGVIIENRASYVLSWDDVAFVPGSLEALASLRDQPLRIVIVTNQSPIGRGWVLREQIDDINDRVMAEIKAAGGRIDVAYICPHAPEDGCDCRKPEPGMLMRAAHDLNIDLRRSVMVGDALSDVGAGQAAGVAESLLVRTGRGADQEQLTAAGDMPPFHIYDSLAAVIAALPALIPVN